MKNIIFLLAVNPKDISISGIFNFAINLQNVLGNVKIVLPNNVLPNITSLIISKVVVHGVWDIKILLVVILLLPFKKIYWYPHGGFNDFIINKSSKVLKKIILNTILLFKSNIIILSTSTVEDKLFERYDMTYKRVKLGCDEANVFKYYTKNNCNILYIGRMSEEKGVHLLIEALRRYNGNISCDLFLHGNESNPFNENDLLKNDISIYRGTLSENKWETLVNYDALILPSFSESFGLVVAEALSTGLPVLVSNKTIWNDAEEQGYGFVFDLNVESIHKALNKFMKRGRKDLMKMGICGRSYMERCYSWDSIASEFKTQIA